MRSPAGSIRNHIPSPASDGYGSPPGSPRRILVTAAPPPSWSNAELLAELRGALGQTLVCLRSVDNAKERATALSHLCRSMVALVGLEMLPADKAALMAMDDKELIERMMEEGQKLISGALKS
jgi:D-serine deaminase-like pyridoxal phosphate-dependent protein